MPVFVNVCLCLTLPYVTVVDQGDDKGLKMEKPTKKELEQDEKIAEIPEQAFDIVAE